MDRTGRNRATRLGRRLGNVALARWPLNHDLPPDDALAIEQLYARYNHAIHLGDGAAWADCFTANGEFSNPREVVSGRQALAAYAAEFSTPRDARYWINNLVLEISGPGVRGSCYLLLLHVVPGEPAALHLTGVYTDTLERTSDGWRFATRHVARDL
ncbi:MAG: nuclear transport factor 2 family protein [Anaerolineaceae bacterium]